MTPQDRQAIERRIIERLVTDAIAAGYSVSVDDGGDVIADHTDNEAMRTLVAGASALADQIEGESA